MADSDYQIGQDIHSLRQRCVDLEQRLVACEAWYQAVSIDLINEQLAVMRGDIEVLRAEAHSHPVDPAPEDVPPDPEPDPVTEPDPKPEDPEIAPDRTPWFHRRLGEHRE